MKEFNDILCKVAEMRNQSFFDITTSKRLAKSVRSRQIIMYILYVDLKYTCTSIAEKFGCNHATVLRAPKQLNSLEQFYKNEYDEFQNIRSVILKELKPIFVNLKDIICLKCKK
jgi:chromosomal replication initiation ATPase DnaA